MKFSYIFRIFIIFIGVIALSIYRPGNARSLDKNTRKNLHVIFDLGGVCIDTDPGTFFWHLGPVTVLNYWRKHGLSNTQILSSFYRILNLVSGIEGNPYNMRDDRGNTMPMPMCEWLLGIKTCRELRENILENIKEHPEWFASKAEQKLMCNMSKIIFNPTTFAKTRKLHSDAIRLVKKYKRNGHNVYILSNFDPESFELLADRYSDFFELFDGIVISGHVQKAKPNNEIFRLFSEKLPVEDCIFIDDQIENIQAARSVGMNAILCTKTHKRFSYSPDLSFVDTRLAQYEYIQPQIVT